MQMIQKRRVWRYLKILLLAIIIASSPESIAFATTSSSPNYQVTESEINSGASLESCSGEYCARASIGDLAVGDSEDATYTTAFGPVTEGEPLLEVIVDPGESNLGILTTEATASKTATVRVRNYLSSGYVLQITGTPPVYAGHTLSTSSTLAASIPGTEQFAINATTNSTPNIGATPVQVPSSQTSFGTVDLAYRTANMFKYVPGDVVARSLSESGRTDYTISMIVNISNATPAGHYSGDFSAVVIPVY